MAGVGLVAWVAWGPLLTNGPGKYNTIMPFMCLYYRLIRARWAKYFGFFES